MVHTLSVDIVIDSKYGDLSRPDIQAYWLAAIDQHYVVGFAGGPPCNTWSCAREQQLLDDGNRRGGPRVVRTGEAPWGKESLRLTELKNVAFGNILMGFTLQALYRIQHTHGVGMAEHAADPNECQRGDWEKPPPPFGAHR